MRRLVYRKFLSIHWTREVVMTWYFPAFLCLPLLLTAQTSPGPLALEVNDGVASFDVKTNVSAVSVHGKSDRLNAHLQVRQEGQQLTLENIEARLDPKTISTGMSLRDDHMRSKIFTTQDGKIPELVFRAERVTCAAPASGQQASCDVAGTFFVRDIGRPLRMGLKLRSDGKQSDSYRVNGEGVVDLNHYEIEPPSQLGVRVANVVRLRVDFLAKESAAVRTAR
jgi:polyisoprenoid-binding protein YceI